MGQLQKITGDDLEVLKICAIYGWKGMEVYFLKKLILHRSDIRGRNESQNIEGCLEQNYRRPLLIPPLCTSQAHFLQSKLIFFNPSHSFETRPMLAHFCYEAQGKAHLDRKSVV